jgi:hypothetical protein
MIYSSLCLPVTVSLPGALFLYFIIFDFRPNVISLSNSHPSFPSDPTPFSSPFPATLSLTLSSSISSFLSSAQIAESDASNLLKDELLASALEKQVGLEPAFQICCLVFDSMLCNGYLFEGKTRDSYAPDIDCPLSGDCGCARSPPPSSLLTIFFLSPFLLSSLSIPLSSSLIPSSTPLSSPLSRAQPHLPPLLPPSTPGCHQRRVPSDERRHRVTAADSGLHPAGAARLERQASHRG